MKGTVTRLRGTPWGISHAMNAVTEGNSRFRNGGIESMECQALTTAKEYFQRIDELNVLIHIKMRQAASLRDSLSISTPPPDAEHVSHTRNMNTMADKIAAVVDAERETDALVDELVQLKNELITYVNRLPDPKETMFITERYLEGKETDDIAEAHHYSRRRIQQLLKSGTEHLDAILSGS